MSLNDPSWTGPMDGPFRGRHLMHCSRHPTIWYPQHVACPVCELQQEIVDQRLRCVECRRVNGWQVPATAVPAVKKESI